MDVPVSLARENKEMGLGSAAKGGVPLARARQLVGAAVSMELTPKHVGVLKKLSIFGIRADYIAQFRDFLEEDGRVHHQVLGS